MSENKIVTIEINLDDDYANACSYHVDYLEKTSSRNLRTACEKQKTNRWALVGLAYSISEGCEKAKRIRETLCEMHGKIPYGIHELVEKMKDKTLEE